MTTQHSSVAVFASTPESLEKIEGSLVRGDRRQAYHYALDQKLWAHALIIASGIDKDAWHEAVNEFLKAGLTSDVASTRGRDGLRFAYSLFSGQGSAAGMYWDTTIKCRLMRFTVQQLMPRKLLSETPGVSDQTSSIKPETLSTWAETVAMIISSPLSPDNSAALTALGDQLLANHWVEAAHAWYVFASRGCSNC
jgi:COPII coat assembly protein SEC16